MLIPLGCCIYHVSWTRDFSYLHSTREPGAESVHIAMLSSHACPKQDKDCIACRLNLRLSTVRRSVFGHAGYLVRFPWSTFISGLHIHSRRNITFLLTPAVFGILLTSCEHLAGLTTMPPVVVPPDSTLTRTATNVVSFSSRVEGWTRSTVENHRYQVAALAVCPRNKCIGSIVSLFWCGVPSSSLGGILTFFIIFRPGSRRNPW